ncbi:MAG TPA: hypothetical protein VL860_12960 [Planctomycetota bacterium]|jgi:hypothetical protein|nr:hypothetical protein [Planctomycetota bacterium]
MSNEPPIVNPYAPPGAPGSSGPGDGSDRPPRPLWETIAIFACGLTLIPFFLPEQVFSETGRFVIGIAAVLVLAWIASRRLKAMRGMLSAAETPKPGSPKPYHVERKFDTRKR